MSNIFGYPEFDLNGVKVLTRTQGTYADMMMNITVYRMEKGKSLSFSFATQEMALLLIQGAVTYNWQGNTASAARKDFFKEGPGCLHVCKKVSVTVTAGEESEILVQCASNEKTFKSKFYTPESCGEETFGQNQFEGKAQRTVRTLFDIAPLRAPIW